MKKLKRKSFLPLVLEFISVVFAVLLALGLNSYKQQSDLRDEAKTLTEKIVSECKRNLDLLEVVNAENHNYLNYLDSLSSSKQEITSFRIELSGELLHSSAWNYTQNSPAFNYIDSQLLEKTTEVYETQEYFMKVSGLMFQSIGEMQMLSDNIEAKTLLKTCHYYTRNVVNTGQQLEEVYKQLLATQQQK